MKLVIIAVNDDGCKIANCLHKTFNSSTFCDLRKQETSSAEQMRTFFSTYSHIVFLGASGIVMRLIGPLVNSKYTDPAVVAVDTAGRYAISLLSGHEGGANKLAYKVAAVIGAEAIITTGTESHKQITLGIGCRRGIRKEELIEAVTTVLSEAKISLDSIRCAASIDIKRDETGLLQGCEELNLPLLFFSSEQIKTVQSICSVSEVVQKNLGLNGVCEPCALLAGRNTRILLPKQIKQGVTVACAKENSL